MVYINDLLKRCEERGYKISRYGLYLAGYRLGFIYKDEAEEKHLNKEKFEAWLDTIMKEAPEGYLSAKMIVSKYGVSLCEAYSVLNDEECNVVRVGGYGVMYGEPKSVEKVVRKRGKSHKYDWKGKDGND